MKTVLLVLPDHFSIRNFVYSPFLEQNFQKENLKIVFVLRNPALHRSQTSQYPNKNWFCFEDLEAQQQGLAAKLSKKINELVYELLTYRFNKRNKSRSLAAKENLPKEYLISQYDKIKWYWKFPFPKSKLIYGFFYLIYNSSLSSQKRAKALIKKYQPCLVLTTDPQTTISRPYFIEAKKQKSKTLCYINSWDYLTTDGPVLKKIAHFAVWGKQMRKELVELNHSQKPIDNVGPLHFDYSFQTGYIWNKETLSRFLKISPKKAILTYGVCGERVGRHEPEIAFYLAKYLTRWPERQLIIRGHPADKTIPQRFEKALACPNVSLSMGHHFDDKKTTYDDVKMLYSLLYHSAVVLCGGTTLTLDALRFERPVVNIAFDGTLKLPETASVIKEYKFDHYAPLLDFKAIDLVKSFEQLNQAIERALQNPTEKLAGIKKLKAQYLEPLDGRASQRLFNLIKNIC